MVVVEGFLGKPYYIQLRHLELVDVVVTAVVFGVVVGCCSNFHSSRADLCSMLADSCGVWCGGSICSQSSCL